MIINAPYNFAPLADQVYLPAWGDQVTHDIPFRDGYCGEIELTITAHSPILVGGEEIKPGEVHFYQQPDGKYAIPGSSLKGMLRSVLEIATFSRMRQVDDMRYGLRDISGAHIKAVYPKAVVGEQKVGYMQLGDDNKVTIAPCKFAKVRHEDIEARLGIKPRPYIFEKSKPSVPEKYEAWDSRKEAAAKAGLIPFTFNTEDANDGSGHQRATDLGNGKLTGTLVLTGQISDRSADRGKLRGKHHDFLFYGNAEKANFPVAECDWQNFLFVHGDQDKQKANGAWCGYWKTRFYKREPVPVFYVEHKTGVHVGLALLLKLAGDFSVHDLINGRQQTHLDTVDGFDFSDVLFGATDNAKHGALKSRLSFLPAIAQGNTAPSPTAPTILNGPKASYFPNYLVQNQKNGKLVSNSYATYVDRDLAHQPGIRGWKRYPVHANNIGVPELTPDQKKNKAVQTILHPLPANTTFTTTLSFHNLREIELGAVLWGLMWGNAHAATHRHSIGMGKPFGFGQITFLLKATKLRANDKDVTAIPAAAALIQVFAEHMKVHINGWVESPQLVNLLAMANPVIGDDKTKRQFQGELKHMVMGMGNSNEFVTAKMAGSVLPAYACGAAVALKPRFKPVVAPTLPKSSATAVPAQPTAPLSPAEKWLDDNIASIIKSDGGKPDTVLRGAYLAQQWRSIKDDTLKSGVHQLIRSKWKAKGWWEASPDAAAKEAKKIYPLD